MVPPQFTANAASRDPNRSASCIGLFPSPPTATSAEPLRKEFHISVLAVLHPPAALWGNGEMCTGFHHSVMYIIVLVYHCYFPKSIKTAEKIEYIYKESRERTKRSVSRFVILRERSESKNLRIDGLQCRHIVPRSFDSGQSPSLRITVEWRAYWFSCVF